MYTLKGIVERDSILSRAVIALLNELLHRVYLNFPQNYTDNKSSLEPLPLITGVYQVLGDQSCHLQYGTAGSFEDLRILFDRPLNLLSFKALNFETSVLACLNCFRKQV